MTGARKWRPGDCRYGGRVTESQRQPVPRNDSAELDTAVAFLDFARQSVLKKTDGLSPEQLRRVMVDSGTNLLGLVQHLTDAERYWFGCHVAGQQEYADVNFAMEVPPGRAPAEVLAAYRASIDDSNAIIAAAGSPEAVCSALLDGQPCTLRWVVTHMTSETARHAGHADILREQIDQVTGR